ncbi:uncharacterized protein LOC120284157 [Dioscorea cayenensis subsp. rotundata]|uniref:Uncharacterized protein LOC120284157 n=1 Tax=Dioscorea cayennensis subsp. rotundata TaxID=55577 RepID=A0AB40D3J5_DIOCR|nr:uncharacterized protein LOC120284157 [Dioscorea cayenensis subsp. rotundata]
MDDALIDAYLHQQAMGNRVGGTFTTHALDNIVNEMKDKFPDKPIDKEKLQNRMKNIKRPFTRCYDIFKNGMSGFAWSPTTEMWNAEPEVWQHLIEVKPEASEWMNKSIRNYEKLVQLYGQDRATGQHAETASEMRRRRLQNSGNTSRSPYSADTINDIDFMVSQNEVNLENLCENENMTSHDNEVEDEASPLDQPSQFEAPSSSRSKRVRRNDNHEDADMSIALTSIASALVQSTKTMEKTNATIEKSTNVLEQCVGNRDPLKDFDVWDMVTNIGIPQSLHTKAYVFLVKDPKMLESVIRCPDSHRKSVLLELMGHHHESQD